MNNKVNPEEGIDKEKIKEKKVYKDPYAAIDWEKAAKIFQNSGTDVKENREVPKVKDVLKVLAAVGAVGLTFAFPGAGAAIGSLIIGDQQYSRWSVNKKFKQLHKQKYIDVEENSDGTTTVKITKNGMKRALTYQLDEMQLTKIKWDHKWRVVIFDVPEKYKKLRDLFRMRLKQLGLYPLQQSVFVSPYPCFDQIEFLREIYSVSISVRYMLVDKIEDDDAIKGYFELA
ncbi:MAG: Repressor in ring oxydation complex/ phenylacetic acid degradation pathway related protein (PaaX) [Candidatus Gottesmanbacteria bacterium GW2011_GWC2_39_8]|uniref:Repressor in ring oxydation complex/ phenylacetic acid degradation pathway related protein (PaaX) n=1 Tax=Candidatus Gottesmanbacteria bacterium GW2011_GWC2_39_8 TaxID=1618450 RepID=A0A0G0S5E0_9BACT|nr:MAG: Repressor in ring oxydation complex/ phenylacetic acid degradation pathway related protein (PaaX) [Candidatus Gottesmanbacteria bacterium GW2011_GWC2_39_8]